uniref:Uncharacterized protein n=1 Tax=Candidatus Kentrum sp. MB TaxID=2138164 RepID=A0A450XGA9_9GAMM|nr:MAG: hypothetical protein BECKMB1821G_GA0114241_100410 [Candidatus Kentron sp. MB]VFK28331.1 MAG: hypothetical protein BECKMB1821I_GA0114274_100610 [Candidatus Kentron sp. MB]VFK74208.1 MAG: hypothetical protein BECKMB1821H_GA0114242_100228 [Candidatus Kentron sp. MB]
MPKKQSIVSLPSPEEAGQIYHAQLGARKNDAYKYNRLIMEHTLSPDGSIKRSVSMLIEALEDGVEEFFWRVPLLSENSKVAGIRVAVNSRIRGYQSQTMESMHEIVIRSEMLTKGETLHIGLEYYVSNVCKVNKKGLLHYELDYTFAYKPISTTKSLEIRLHAPRGSRARIETNLPKPESFIVGDNRLIIATEEKFQQGDIAGNIQLEYRSPYFVPLFSLVISLLFSAVLVLIQHGQTIFGSWYLAVIAALFFITSFVSLKVFRIE